MARINRPNQDALADAIDIYRDTMRPFIVNTLRALQIAPVEELISEALSPAHSNQFRRDLRRHNDVEAAIDIGDFPPLVREYWPEFQTIFNYDKNMWNALYLIANARNRVAHPDQRDLDIEYVCAHLFHIADVLGLIDATDQKREVEAIRDDLRKLPVPPISQSALAVELQTPRPEPSRTPPPPASSTHAQVPRPKPTGSPPYSETTEIEVSELQPGRPISGTFLTRQVRRLVAKNGNEFLQTRLYDKSGEWVIARMFSAPEEVFDTIGDDMTVDVDGYCQNFQGQMVILMDSIDPAQEQWATPKTPSPSPPSKPTSPAARVSDIQPGRPVNGRFMARQVARLIARNGNVFLQTRLYDKSGEWVIARMFSAPEEVYDSIQDEMTVDVDGYCQDFQGQNVVHITSIQPAQEQPDPDDLPF